MKSFILAFTCLFSFISHSQNVNYNDSLITVKGQVRDTVFDLGYYNMLIVDKTLGKGIFGNSDGSFTITLKKGDEIGVSVVDIAMVVVPLETLNGLPIGL